MPPFLWEQFCCSI